MGKGERYVWAGALFCATAFAYGMGKARGVYDAHSAVLATHAACDLAMQENEVRHAHQGLGLAEDLSRSMELMNKAVDRYLEMDHRHSTVLNLLIDCYEVPSCWQGMQTLPDGRNRYVGIIAAEVAASKQHDTQPAPEICDDPEDPGTTQTL